MAGLMIVPLSNALICLITTSFDLIFHLVMYQENTESKIEIAAYKIRIWTEIYQSKTII